MNPTVSHGPVLHLFNIVHDTLSNTEGLQLFVAMRDALTTQEKPVTLSLLNLTAFSSSFLNSSFGALYEQCGSTMMKRIRLTDYKPAQLKQLKDYMANMAAVHHSE